MKVLKIISYWDWDKNLFTRLFSIDPLKWERTKVHFLEGEGDSGHQLKILCIHPSIDVKFDELVLYRVVEPLAVILTAIVF